VLTDQIDRIGVTIENGARIGAQVSTAANATNLNGNQAQKTLVETISERDDSEQLPKKNTPMPAKEPVKAPKLVSVVQIFESFDETKTKIMHQLGTRLYRTMMQTQIMKDGLKKGAVIDEHVG
jgi:hypothetical protein